MNDRVVSKPTSSKLHRWLDLLATLLARRAPATFVEIARDVPAYLADGSVAESKPSDSLKRMFERDKLELRELGIPIISVGDEGEIETAYQLKRTDFYLPYLAIMSDRGVAAPEKVDRYGYHSLTTLAFEPDELEAIRDAANRVAQMGDESLVDDARAALRKLAFDLPFGAIDQLPGDAAILPPTARPDPATLVVLGDALFARKRVSFAYQAMGSEESAERTVEPYGLFFLNGHWYLTARDVAKDALRNFRVSRVGVATPHKQKSGTPDYAIPHTFSLREHARSRQAWEIGDGEAFDAIVEFHGHTGAVTAAAALGNPIDGTASRRRFTVRRSDSFARWLLAFAGDACPIEPPPLVAEYASLVERTRAVYERVASA
jgi:proteasome accessory factor B